MENSDESFDGGDNPLHSYTLTSQQTMFIPHPVTSEETNIAPGEGIEPVPIFSNNIQCEELTFSCREILFLIPKSLKLSQFEYFNQRLWNYLLDFPSDYDYMFFALSVLQQIKLQGQVNVAMEMAFCGHLTAKEFSHNFSETVKSFNANDKAYQLMNTIKGTLAYWK